MHYLCVTPERHHKTMRLMRALEQGFPVGASRIYVGKPPPRRPFVVWGQIWLTLDMIPEALKEDRPFWYIDNGYWNSAKGGEHGNYRFTYRSMTPIMLRDSDPVRARPVMNRLRPWRKDGKHIVLAMPGMSFGKAMGLDMIAWSQTIEARLKAVTDRPIVVRNKASTARALWKDLENAWALVTHSSNVAVDAVISGTPVFVEPTSAAAPVGQVELGLIEQPVMPDRVPWLNSLACQQFTINEMRSGICQRWMQKVAEQVDIPGAVKIA
jgi:hypothetical protein